MKPFGIGFLGALLALALTWFAIQAWIISIRALNGQLAYEHLLRTGAFDKVPAPPLVPPAPTPERKEPTR